MFVDGRGDVYLTSVFKSDKLIKLTSSASCVFFAREFDGLCVMVNGKINVYGAPSLAWLDHDLMAMAVDVVGDVSMSYGTIVDWHQSCISVCKMDGSYSTVSMCVVCVFLKF